MLEKIIKIAKDLQTMNSIMVCCDIQFNYLKGKYTARDTYSNGTIIEIGDGIPGVETHVNKRRKKTNGRIIL